MRARSLVAPAIVAVPATTVLGGVDLGVSASGVGSSGDVAAGLAATLEGLAVSESLSDAGGAWGYALVFVLAAIPWIEILLVIPPAIGLGMDPVAVGLVAFLGNALSAALVAVFGVRIATWWSARRGEDDVAGDRSGRSRRARRLWDRYGLGGLAIAAPVLTGVHLAVLFAVGLGSSARAIVAWMTASVALWTVVTVAVSVAGLSLLGVA